MLSCFSCQLPTDESEGLCFIYCDACLTVKNIYFFFAWFLELFIIIIITFNVPSISYQNSMLYDVLNPLFIIRF